jgi:hypothetical protein
VLECFINKLQVSLSHTAASLLASGFLAEKCKEPWQQPVCFTAVGKAECDHVNESLKQCMAIARQTGIHKAEGIMRLSRSEKGGKIL